MSSGQTPKTFVFQTFPNSYHYFYQDAEYLHGIAKSEEFSKKFERVRLCRTALLLYIFNLEGLINRAMDHFLPGSLRDFFLEREQNFSIEDKYQLLLLLASQDKPAQFDTSTYPWSHFAELIRLRNDFVHPKHDRPAYYRAITSHRWNLSHGTRFQ